MRRLLLRGQAALAGAWWAHARAAECWTLVAMTAAQADLVAALAGR